MAAERRGVGSGPPRRILVTKLKQIGDVLLATPAIAALREAFPAAEIWALVPRGSAAILAGNPHLDRVLAVDRGIPATAAAALRLALFRPHLAVQLGLSRRERLLGMLCGARRRAGFAAPDETAGLTDAIEFDWSRHVVVNAASLLERLGIARPPGELVLPVAAEDLDWVERELAGREVGPGLPLAVVHPVTRWAFKSGRDETMAEVIDGLQGRLGLTVAVTSGAESAEAARARRILGLASGTAIDLTGRLSLGRLAALLKRAALAVTVDGAPMHMAAALQVPQVVLFGPTGEANWSPWRAPHAIVTTPMPCRPCGQDGCDGSKISECLLAISAEQVLAASAALVGGQAAGRR